MSDKSEHPPVPDAFAALGVRPSILRALADAKFTTPSEIQTMLIPRALAGVDILGGARGRVIDLLDRRIINFSNVRFVVLDEVDRMLDIGFRDDIRNILSRISGMQGRGARGEGQENAEQQSAGAERDSSQAHQ